MKHFPIIQPKPQPKPQNVVTQAQRPNIAGKDARSFKPGTPQPLPSAIRPPHHAAMPKTAPIRPGSQVPHKAPAVPRPIAAQRMANPAVSNPSAKGASSQPRMQYNLSHPIYMAGGRQQIRMTIQGTHRVAGSVEVSPKGSGQMHISDLKVDRDHRRQGLATQLVNAALTTVRSRGYSAASLEARPFDGGISPQGLVSMYKQMGFKNVGLSRRGSPLMERRFK